MYAVTPTLSVEALHARSTSDEDDEVMWRFFGVDGGVVSAAAAGVEATTDNTSRSATTTAAITDRLRRPRSPLIVPTTLPRDHRRGEPSIGPCFGRPAASGASGGAGESDDELRARADPRQGHAFGRHDRVTGDLHPVGERGLARPTDRVLIRNPAVPPFHAELVFAHHANLPRAACGTQAPW